MTLYCKVLPALLINIQIVNLSSYNSLFGAKIGTEDRELVQTAEIILCDNEHC